MRAGQRYSPMSGGCGMGKAEEGVAYLRLVMEAETTNRAEALEDLKFRYGDQWPAEIINSRKLESRPALTINETDAYIRKIENQQRQQRPRMNPHPTGSRATVEVAKVLKGLCRHIEVNSDADNAYDLAFSFAITSGVGYFRLYTDYVREDSFDQDIYIGQVENPFTVYFDPNSSLPDGSDAERCLVTDLITKDAFNRLYPGAQMENFREVGSGEITTEWVTKEDIRLAEYMYVDRVKADLVMLSDGTSLYGDQMPPAELLAQAGVRVAGTRPSFKRAIKWCKQTAFEVLEEKIIPGRYIPIVPVYGVQVVLDGKRKRFGLVRFARDPQTMINFWQTAMTESAGMATKAKWLIAEGQDEGHENEFAQANTRAFPVLRYKTVDVDGKPAPPPIRIDPPQVDGAALQNALIAGENLKRVLGVYDPQMRKPGPVSGKAIHGEAMQAEESNYNYFDNLTRSIKHAARIILGWVPTTYDVQRMVRIIGDDGKPQLVTLNEQVQQEPTGAEAGAMKIKNDVTVPEYDVVMDTGPGFNTKRQEAVEALGTMLAGNKELWQIAGDLIFRNMDFPGAEIIADRLAAANPLAQIDENSDIPPKAQIMIKHLQAQLQQAGQQIKGMGAEIQYKHGLEQIKQEGATKRTLMQETGNAHVEQMRDATKQHDVEARALTAQNVEEIKGIVALLLKHIDTKHLEKELEARNQEQKAKADEAAVTLQ